WGPLNSVPNRNSAAAWSSMVTGLNPGKHGIYWFTEDDPTDYTYKFINASYRRGKTMWRRLSEEGRKVVAINVPLTFPAEEVDGITVAGLDAPGVDDPRFTHPPGFRHELVEAAGGEYHIHSGHNLFSDPARVDEGLERLHRSIDARAAAAAHTMEKHPWDFFMVVFTESDVIQHFFFRQMESPRADDPAHHRSAIRDVYEHLDRVVGELVAKVDDETLVILVSDHGARQDDGLARALPNWLEQLGLLSYKKEKAFTPRSLAMGAVKSVYRQLDKRLSTEIKHRLSERFPKLRRGVEVSLSYGEVDWSRTTAYTDGKRPEIWVNLQGRQQQGIVPSQRFDEVRASIIEQLTTPVCAASGRPVVTGAYRREEAYSGPFVERSPDLVLEWAESGTCLDLEYPDGRRVVLNKDHLGDDPVAEALNGGHSQHGVIGLLGAGAGRGRVEGAEIMDVATTVLFALDTPLPADADGKVLRASLSPELAQRKERRASASDDAHDGGDTGYSEEEEAEIRERLHALGYVE
ncbi:MAG TPA: alkaline phosphatase family protein, partial [Actinomycetota bacterium]|nr:alkaline phosphatase family protein [Actinomycetota bacterium]